MELVHDLCVTAFVAILLSFLVAKLISVAMASDGTSDRRWESSKYDVGDVEMEEIKFEEEKLQQRLRGHARTPKRVRFAEVNNTERVYQFSLPAELPVVASADDQVEVFELREGSKSGVDDGKLLEADELREELHSGSGDDELIEVDESRVEAHSGNGDDGLVEVDDLREESEPGVDEDKMVDVDGPRVESQPGIDDDKLVEVDAMLEEEQFQVDDDKLVEEVVECDSEANCDDLVFEKPVLDDKVEECKNLVRTEEPKVLEEEKGELVSDDEDWEGIERSQLEKDFAAAAAFIGGDGEKGFRLDNIESDVQMQLYGLHKVAMEGPCREPQPMALKMSARAKWVRSCYV